jgi:hypothetical protein
MLTLNPELITKMRQALMFAVIPCEQFFWQLKRCCEDPSGFAEPG